MSITETLGEQATAQARTRGLEEAPRTSEKSKEEEDGLLHVMQQQD